MLYSDAMNEAMKKLVLTMAYQRQTELQVAIQQLGQALQMTKDPGERQFLEQQRAQMEYMLQELTGAIQGAEAAGK